MLPAFHDERATLYQGDALDALRALPDSSVGLICTDPPYYRVKGEWWDRQWDSADGFLAWVDALASEWARVLKPNGSLYCFASPRMAARVEVTLARRFNVLNRVRWQKEAGWHQKAEKEALRSFLSPWEEIIFAEHHGSDNTAKGEAGYAAKCDEVRGFVFEPLRAYLDGERQRAGVTREQVERATGTQMFGHWFSRVQWALPTAKHYATLQALFNAGPPPDVGGFLRREYEGLRREYEGLRREYEGLRRPFSVSADVPFTDVWTFPTVPARKGKHPCEKPVDLIAHIIRASSRPGDLVLDSFTGSGVVGEQALALGRRFVGSEIDEHWCRVAWGRIAATSPPLPAVESSPVVEPRRGQLLLFEAAS